MHRHRSRLSCAVAATLASLTPLAATAAEPETDGTSWALGRLDLEITLDGRGDRVRVGGSMHLHALEASMGPTIAVNNREPVMRFREVTLVDHPGTTTELNAEHPDAGYVRLAHLRAATAFAEGDSVVVDFVLEQVAEGPQAVFRKGYALVSWVEAWYPVPAVGGADPIAADRMTAPGTTRFRLPRGWSAVTNGVRTHREETAEESLETWKTAQPVARAFTAGPFDASVERVGDLEIGVYLLSPKPYGAREQATTLGRALAAMEARFGPYPYPAYAIAEVPEDLVTWYAASEQGFINARTSAFEVEGGNVPLFAHEAAHGWWGNLVNTRGPGAKLCSESLAQYGAVVAIETIEGREAMRDFLEFSREGYSAWQCALGYFGIVREGGDKPLAMLDGGRFDHDLSDSKGHWFYHMVRLRLGDDVFFDTLRRLIDDFAGRAMSLDDVRAAFLAAAPDDPDIEWFLAQWLDRTGAPVLDLEWWSIRRGSAIALSLEQTQPGEPYLLEVPVEITMRDGSTRSERIDLRERQTRLEIEMPSRAVEVRLDPYVEVLMWRPSYGPVPEALTGGTSRPSPDG